MRAREPVWVIYLEVGFAKAMQHQHINLLLKFLNVLLAVARLNDLNRLRFRIRFLDLRRPSRFPTFLFHLLDSLQ
jgi:hypothetical protein